MGTRADFYVGRGEGAEWLGSIAWDGNPAGIDESVLTATDEITYREAVADFLTSVDDATLPEMGWPWPWDDSRTTDYAYAFDGGHVQASSFGHPWFDVDPQAALYGEPEGYDDTPRPLSFPVMSGRKNVRHDGGSGAIFVTFGGSQ